MPSFTVPIASEGPILDIQVGVSDARGSALVDQGHEIPQKIKIRALIDTGASCTCVDESVLKQLGLSPTGSAPVSTPTTGSNPHEAAVYDITLLISYEEPAFVAGVVGVIAMGVHPDQSIRALIGRDILEKCLLCYDGQRKSLIFSY